MVLPNFCFCFDLYVSCQVFEAYTDGTEMEVSDFREEDRLSREEMVSCSLWQIRNKSTVFWYQSGSFCTIRLVLFSGAEKTQEAGGKTSSERVEVGHRNKKQRMAGKYGLTCKTQRKRTNKMF